MKNIGMVIMVAGVVVFVIAIISRLTNLQPLVQNPVPGLVKICEVLLLTAIAIGVNKK